MHCLRLGRVHYVLRGVAAYVKQGLVVTEIKSKFAATVVIEKHYLHRRPPISFAYGLFLDNGETCVGVLTFGTPASRHLQKSVCPTNPSVVIELNRLWVDDTMPRNTESWFISRCLAKLPPRLVCSYADTKQGHVGYVYRASNWFYAGQTDQDRKTPRFDYVVAGKHSRDAFRGGSKEYTRVRRLPKHRYWTVTGNRRDRRDLSRLCGWNKQKWGEET